MTEEARDTRDAEVDAAVERMLGLEPGAIASYVTIEDRTAAALAKIAAATQVASGRQDTLQAAVDDWSRSEQFLIDALKEEYHSALVNLHLATVEWMFLVNQK